MNSQNNWYVITGPPSSGKTTVLKLLSKKGFKITEEVARKLIDQELKKGRTLEQIRENEIEFQKAQVNLKIQLEKSLSKNEMIFFDRGMHDSIAYLKKCGITDEYELSEIAKLSKYKKVFIFDLLQYSKDYARTETAEEAKEIDSLLEETYIKYGHTVVRVPVMKSEKRMEFILNNL